MANETQDTVADGLGGNFDALRVMLSEAALGFASGGVCVVGDGTSVDVGGAGRWPASTGFDLDSLRELERYLGDEFMPALQAGIQGKVYRPNFEPASFTGNQL